jgi:CRISPR/Cas system-associated protein Cas5 (RAMP superfamily)
VKGKQMIKTNRKVICQYCKKVLANEKEYIKYYVECGNSIGKDMDKIDYEISFEMWSESIERDHFVNSCPKADEVIKKENDKMNEAIEREAKYEKMCEDFRRMKTIQKVFSENKDKLPFSYKTFERRYLKDEKVINEMLKLNLIIIKQGNRRRTVKVYSDKEVIKFISKLA